MKRLSLAVLPLALVLAACGGGDDDSDAAPTPTYVSSIPSPAAEDVPLLLAHLQKALPELDGDHAVSDARNTCSSILGGSTSAVLQRNTIIRFSRKGVVVTPAQATKLLAVVRAEPWCKPVS